MKVFAYMPVWGQSGWEVLCRGMLLALDRLGVVVSLMPKEDWNLERVDIDDEEFSRLNRMVQTRFDYREADLQIVQQYVPAWYLESGFTKDAKGTAKVCVSLFETDRCPNAWVGGLNSIHETWVFSEFNKVGWEKSGVKKVRVMPFGVNEDVFNPKVEPVNIQGRKKFAFIANGDVTERKWFEGLIEAFVSEFTDEDDVCLIIKGHSGGFVKRYKNALVDKFRNCAGMFKKEKLPTILLLGDKVPCKEMPKFYAAGDCYVLASRGEGLGLPYAEALACGKPVIATRWGGQLEFLNDSNAYFVPCDIQTIDDMEYIRKCLWALNHKWATPHVKGLQEMMRWVYTFYDEAKKKGEQGAVDMSEKTWDKVGLWMIRRTLELQGRIKEKEVVK